MQYNPRVIAVCITCCSLFAFFGTILGLIINSPLFGFIAGIALGALYWYAVCWATERFAVDVHKAQLIDAATSPNLYKVVRKLSDRIGIEQPIVYVIPEEAPNVFSIARPGRSPILVFTRSLTQHLQPDEVKAVFSLCLSRLSQEDAMAAGICSTLTGIPLYALTNGVRQWLSQKLKTDPQSGITVLEKILIGMLVPICILLLRLAYDKRSLENAEDKAVEIVENPEILISAFDKIEAHISTDWWGKTIYNPAISPLFVVPALARNLQENIDPVIKRSQSMFLSLTPSLSERKLRLLGIEKHEASNANNISPVLEG